MEVNGNVLTIYNWVWMLPLGVLALGMCGFYTARSGWRSVFFPTDMTERILSGIVAAVFVLGLVFVSASFPYLFGE